MTPLRQKMINDMKLRGFSPRTQESYLEAVTGLAKFFNQSPDRLSKEQLQTYLLYLMEDKKLSWSSCNVAVSAFRFLYGKTLENESMSLSIPPRKKVNKLPEILSAEEIERLFAATDNPKHRMILMTAYGGGLRVSEVVKLKVNDIHKDRMTVRVDQGKGNKDRYTILSKRLLEELRVYWTMYRPPLWLFPSSRDGNKPLNISSAQRIYYKSKEKAKITKGRGIRIVNVENGKVTFKYRDRKDKGILKKLTLEANEFIRRFLLHVLPNGFMRIRQFGFLANRSKKRCLSRYRELMGLSPELPELEEKTIQELMFELTGVDVNICPVCKKGRMRQSAKIPRCTFFLMNGSSGKAESQDSS